MRIAALLLLALSAAPAAAQWRPEALPGRLEARSAPEPRHGPVLTSPELTGPRYAAMYAGGALGSALGLLAGLAGAAVVSLADGCIDCGGGPGPLHYAIAGATTSLGTGLVVTAVAEEPVPSGFWSTSAEVARSPLFRPALLGAVAGIAVGGGLGLLVDRVAPSDEPYPLVAFNLGQAAASVLAVRAAAGGRGRP